MKPEYDIIVVGVGTVGSAACMHMAHRRLKVLGLDAFAIPNERGSTSGGTRAFRLCYFEHPDYVPLLIRSHALWSELEDMSGVRVQYRTKGIYIGAPDSDLVSGSHAAAERFGIEHERLDRRTLVARYPQFVVPDDFEAILEPHGSAILGQTAIGACAELALRAGAHLRPHEPVRSWTSEDDHVRVQTDRGEYRARHLVFTAGAWAPRLITGLGVPMTVTRQTMGWFWPDRPDLFELGAIPTFGLESREDPGLFYGFPMIPGVPGFKVAIHLPQEEVDPSGSIREPDQSDLHALRRPLERWLPEAAGPVVALRTCLYANTPDAHFIVDRHPEHDNVTVVAGLSGHGFKFAPVLGEILADLATEGGTTHPIDFLRLSRFNGADDAS